MDLGQQKVFEEGRGAYYCTVCVHLGYVEKSAVRWRFQVSHDQPFHGSLWRPGGVRTPGRDNETMAVCELVIHPVQDGPCKNEHRLRHGSHSKAC